MAKSSNIRIPRFIITIDGPAGSGKSTTAGMLARKLDYLYLDTGAMYRAITLKVIQAKLIEEQVEKIISLLREAKIDLKNKNGYISIYLDEIDVTNEIRSKKVDKEVSWVCQIPDVREHLVKLQRDFGRDGGVVAEGRDIGTVVFPEADLKFFLTADLQTRAKRRWNEKKERGEVGLLEDIAAEIDQRDKIDFERELSPLIKAEGAVEVNTTNLTIDGQVNLLYKKIVEYAYQLEIADRSDKL